jgi:5-methylcytosine-specific restriction endonuclease McrA
MADRTCSVSGCEKLHAARGWCANHYQQWYNSPGSGAGTLQVVVNGGACSISGCERQAKARGWCDKHWTRWSRHGDPLAGVRHFSGIRAGTPCTVGGCDAASEKRGLCGKHYRRWQRHDDTTVASWQPAPRASSCVRCGSPDIMPGRRLYCSNACEMAIRRAAQPKPPLAVNECADCGTPFQRATRRGPSSGPRRCKNCTALYRQASNREYARRRRARKQSVPVEVFSDAEIYERDEWACALCREPVDRTLRHPDPLSPTIDHIVPLAKGGHHVRANCQLAHLRCNVRKGASLISSYGEAVPARG